MPSGSLESLPFDLLYEIVQVLNFQDIMNLAQTCWFLHTVLCEEKICRLSVKVCAF